MSEKTLKHASGAPPKSEVGEILPQSNRRNVLITSALPYVNNVPHLGTLIGCILSADVFARYCRLREYNTLFVCGTDEYGTATETKALAEGCSPRELCDKYHAIHKRVYDWFNIECDHFGRTSTDYQTEIAQDIFNKIYENKLDGKDLTVEKVVEQLFCEKCNKFLADRFVEGECPHCKYPDARGDQCDGCSKLLNPTELLKPRCKVDGSSPVIKTSEHIFLNLPVLQESVEKFVERNAEVGNWTENSRRVTETWLKGGLEPRCISRDLKWGTPVPLEKFKDKVFYVWFDAPIGYISITSEYTSQWQKWWKSGRRRFMADEKNKTIEPKKTEEEKESKEDDEVKLYQFLGKDNIPFHTVIFPATLIGADDDYTLLHHCSTTEYINYEDGKFSKSRNVGVFGDQAESTGIPAFCWRFYLLSNRPERNDTVFSWTDFMKVNNGELLAAIGNFALRAVKFVSAYCEGKVPPRHAKTESEEALEKGVAELMVAYCDALESVSLREAVTKCVELGRLGNKYMQEQKPWELVKSQDTERVQTVAYYLIQVLCHLQLTCEALMPSFAAKVRAQLKCEQWTLVPTYRDLLPSGHEIGEPEGIVPRLKATEIGEWRVKFSGKPAAQNLPKFALDLRVGKVKEVEVHPTNESLYVLQIDVGELTGNKPSHRQIVSGLVKHCKKEQLLDSLVVLCCNLKPQKFRGVLSQGMVVCVVNDDSVLPLTLPAGSTVGSSILPPNTCFDVKSKPFNFKKAWAGLGLQLNDQKQVVCAGAAIEVINVVDDKKLRKGFKARKNKNKDTEHLSAEAAAAKEKAAKEREAEIAERERLAAELEVFRAKQHVLFVRGINKGETEEEIAAATLVITDDRFAAGTKVQ